jgi:hypothetical protein
MLTGRAGAGARTHPPSPSQRNRHWDREYVDGSNKWEGVDDPPSGRLPSRRTLFSRGEERDGDRARQGRKHGGGRQAGRQAGSASTTPLLVGWAGSLSLAWLGATNTSVVSSITKTHQKQTRIRVHNSRVLPRLAILALHNGVAPPGKEIREARGPARELPLPPALPIPRSCMPRDNGGSGL